MRDARKKINDLQHEAFKIQFTLEWQSIKKQIAHDSHWDAESKKYLLAVMDLINDRYRVSGQKDGDTEKMAKENQVTMADKT